MKKLLIFLLMMSMTLLSTSCKKDEKQETQIKKVTTIPKQLKVIQNNIGEIEKELLKLKKELDKSENIEVEKEKEQMIKKLQKERTKETEKTTEKVKVVETHKEKLDKMWTSLENKAEEVHKKLNDYKVIAIKDKADQKYMDQIDEDLNNLTIFIASKDFFNSFATNNDMYNDVSYFLSLYEDYKSEIMKLKYQTNAVYISALKNEWNTALEGMNKVEEQYSAASKQFNKQVKLKDKPSKDDKQMEGNLEKLKLSIDSFKQSINKEDISLLEIKRDLVFKDIEELE